MKHLLAYLQKSPKGWTWDGPLVGDSNADALVEPMQKAFLIAAGDANPGAIRGVYFTEDQQIIVERTPDGGPPLSDTVLDFPVHVIHPGTPWPVRPAPKKRARKARTVKPTPAAAPGPLVPVSIPNLPAPFVRGYQRIIGMEHLKRALEVALVGDHSVSVVADDSMFDGTIHRYHARALIPTIESMGLRISGTVIHSEDPHPPLPKKITDADIQIEIHPTHVRDFNYDYYNKRNVDAMIELAKIRQVAGARIVQNRGAWPLDAEAKRLHDRIVERKILDGMAMVRAVEVARTISAMDDYWDRYPHPHIQPAHLAEAIQYQHFSHLHTKENPAKTRLRKTIPVPVLSHELTGEGWKWSGTVLNVRERGAELPDLLASEIRNIYQAIPASVRRRAVRLSIIDYDRVQVAVADAPGSGPRPHAATWKIASRMPPGGLKGFWKVSLVSAAKKPPYGDPVEVVGDAVLKWIPTPDTWEGYSWVERPKRVPAIYYPELDSVVPSTGPDDFALLPGIVHDMNERRRWAAGRRTHPYSFLLWGD